VFGPRVASNMRLEPRKAIRPSRTATASNVLPLPSTVITFAL
jgi:hypothetical protein